jgi:hypothetical protein
MRNATIALSAVLTIGLAACRVAGPAEAPTPSAQPVAESERLPLAGQMGRPLALGPLTITVLGSADWPAAAQTLGTELRGVSVRVRLASRGSALQLDGTDFQLVDELTGLRYSAGPGVSGSRDLKLPVSIKAGATVEGLLNFTPTRGGRYGLRVVGLDGETALIPLGKIGSAAPAVVTPEPSAAASPSASVATPGETPCILIGGGTWDPPGDDDRAPAIRQESVKLRNVCAESVAVGGWVVHDEGRDHSYTFADGFTFAGGATVMLYSGTGVDTETKLYWGRTRGEVWGQSYPERAYLRDAAGRLVSDWSRFRAP